MKKKEKKKKKLVFNKVASDAGRMVIMIGNLHQMISELESTTDILCDFWFIKQKN